MASRASSFWADDSMPSYLQDDDIEEQERLVGDGALDDGRTALDRTIDRIGMGSYQWTLLSLCGFGWMADNMWIEAVAIILPRVQRHYDVPDNYIGTVSSTMFAGMMFGAIGWGSCSDLLGRSAAFNATLFFTAVFGIFASLAGSFGSLCVILFFLGSAVGGSMPTDGTLLLEHMPDGKQYLVTALSVFFSFGAVFSAVIGLLVLPQNSCFEAECDVEAENRGWKYMLAVLGVITLSMFFARIVFFRLHESPRYLVHAGRHQEALESLQMISRFNGSVLSLNLADVQDVPHFEPGDLEGDPKTHDTSSGDEPPRSTTIFDAGGDLEGQETEPPQHPRHTSSTGFASLDADELPHYHSTSEPSTPESGLVRAESPKSPPLQPPVRPSLSVRPRPRTQASRMSRASMMSRRQSSMYEYEQRVCSALPHAIRRPLWAWWDRIMLTLSPEWAKTTVVVWAVWCAMSAAFTMFNMYLPKLLESKGQPTSSMANPSSLSASLWDMVIFTIGGCPGSILGAYMVESRLGRRWSLAGSTFATGAFCILFVVVENAWAVTATTVGLSLNATIMWAVLYGWTPEIFSTAVRGTACGIASALSRIGGMVSPVLGGILLMISKSLPLYVSATMFTVAGFCILLLREDEGEGGRTKGKRAVIAH
ncbi:major facilitator superfamily domain-containing protein [Schizophyllum amplum]|uniref:Major facilitator superfamily domain-containing protein n=1 Tax=Schizophyllum amplum TaxID=97359 RepID=A0A550CGH5_9AGAR|nr:major facilitator superfamily domain-containing protein [Auriculariopsis ampla]